MWDETLKLTRVEESAEFDLFKALVHRDVTVEDVVQWVTTSTMDRLESYSGGTIEKADSITFIALIELAMRIDPVQYPPLIEFLGELKLYNAVDSATELVLKMQDGSRVWSHLPSLTVWAWTLWTEYESDARKTYLCDAAMELEQQTRWARLNIFLAQVTQAADVEYASLVQVWISDAMDESLLGLCGLRNVFEESVPCEQLVSTAGLLGVCYWFVCAGDRLWENVLNGRKYNKYDGRPGEKYANRSWRGFERERWDVWVQGLRDVKACCAAGQDPEDLLNHALSKIEHVMDNTR
ncbi:hypothetical protein N7457_005878 [Penicillium paradoxum]|uniref:uncharacterized protein n=1 Tax=Penicillium paradoxum TaxID=176176 RepID=UPI002547A204|nr:uncharacterized protein N7457_005878 [Penicillium paradoxum]KAJ5780718.1 hypothetical protein N7457_005878 [Penicillium paradoxum]